MSTASDPPTEPPVVHALLVCRGVETDAEGQISLENVLEILPVEAFPGEIGPLTFVALVRNLPQGPGQGAFLLRPLGGEGAQARLPIEVTVPTGYAGRQVALQVKVASVPVQNGGWYEFAFEWDGVSLATNRFAVGARG